MLTPTVKELPRVLEPIARDTFLAGFDRAATLAAAHQPGAVNAALSSRREATSRVR